MLDGVNREDIMYQEELDALQNFGESITVYRGASREEVKPGLSWSRRRDIAEGSEFYQGRLFVAKVCTSQILLYLMKDADEEEIVAYVVDNYQTIDKQKQRLHWQERSTMRREVNNGQQRDFGTAAIW